MKCVICMDVPLTFSYDLNIHMYPLFLMMYCNDIYLHSVCAIIYIHEAYSISITITFDRALV